MAKKDFKQNPAELFISAPEDAQEAPGQAQEGFTIPQGYKLTRESKSLRMQLLVRPLTKEAIKAEADAQGVSMNDLVNTILEEYLERMGRI